MAKELDPNSFNPVDLIGQAITVLGEEAELSGQKAIKYYEGHPEVRNQQHSEHSDGACYDRLAIVYNEFADKLRNLLKEFRIAELRASNPYYATLSDREIEAKLAEESDLKLKKL